VDFGWDSLIAPIDAERFERAYFSKKPLHLKARALPDSGLETIDGWRLMLQGQPTRRQGRRLVVDLDPAAKRAEPLAPELKAMVDQGGPLIMYGVERVNPTVRWLADTVAAGLGGQAVVNGYLSRHKQDALDLHADNHEVVVLQLHGVKRWTIGTRIAKGLVHSSLFAVAHIMVGGLPGHERWELNTLEWI
jgi:ribosomal protein L16 Arg81 hydroxylase